jgi:hypothetical protein
LTNDAAQDASPTTDGVNVVYVKGCCGSQTVVVYDMSGEEVLIPGFGSYAAANGWLAYEKSGSPQGTQVWTRSPAGQDVQASKFGSASFLRVLGPNGEIVLYNSGRRYLTVPDYNAPPRDIGGSGPGSLFFQNGNLYITIGRSLFQVNP